MKTWLITICVFVAYNAFTQNRVVLETDYTNQVNTKENIGFPLRIVNRINPVLGFQAPYFDNGSLCLVRPLGGISKEGAPDFTKDTYKWDGNKFVTDFTVLKKQIDGVFNKGYGLYQIVLDNPSWDFQRDANGNLEGGTYKGETYGNAEPPRDFNAWAKYLKEVMSFLISTYGREEMLKVQFGIGREIGTKGHWTGTQERFFQFYKRSVDAIHSVLPEAKVGSHFLWGSANNAWGTAFVKWCKANNVQYDFLGVSYYPAYNSAGRTNIKEVYQKDFSVIKDIPEWNEEAKFEIHEFALTSSFGGNSFVTAPAAYQNSFIVGWMKQFFENDIENMFQWGTGEQYTPASLEVLALEGDTYYRNTKNGTQNSTGNYVDALYTSNSSHDELSIMAYNYNANPNSNVSEDLNLVATVNAPNGTSYRYRSGVYNKADSSFTFSAWLNGQTSNGTGGKSKISFNRTLPVFSFLKYEIEIYQSINQAPIASFLDTSTTTLEEGYSELYVKVNASDPDGDNFSVVLLIDSEEVRTETIAPYEWGHTGSPNPAELLGLMVGEHILKAVITDDKGLSTTITKTITVKEKNVAPTVTITSPNEGGEFQVGDEIILSANSTDLNGNLSHVNFKINNAYYKQDKDRPFESTFTPTEPGTYIIGARAFDLEGLTMEVSVTITVKLVTSISSYLGNKISIYPNPSESGIYHLSDAVDYFVYSAEGVLIISGNDKEVDLSDKAKGVYFLKVNNQLVKLVK